MKPRHDPQPREETTNNPFADLLKEKGFAASPPPPPAPVKAADGIDLAKQGKLVVRKERKGRGGKTVTVVSGFALPPAKLEEVARALRKALGCGSVVEGQTIVLQGEIVPRAQSWLQAHGARQVVLGT